MREAVVSLAVAKEAGADVAGFHFIPGRILSEFVTVMLSSVTCSTMPG